MKDAPFQGQREAKGLAFTEEAFIDLVRISVALALSAYAFRGDLNYLLAQNLAVAYRK
jgi:hypothetical protein